MRPDGIQDESSEDESSEDEHQKEHSSSSAEACNISPATPDIGHERASQRSSSEAKKLEPLSDASVVELTKVLERISLAHVSFDECLRAVLMARERYKVARLFEWKDSFIFWTGFTEEYIRINKEKDTDNYLESLHDMLQQASLELCMVQRTLNIEAGEFHELEWS